MLYGINLYFLNTNTGYPIKILHKAVIEGIFDLTDINIKHL